MDVGKWITVIKEPLGFAGFALFLVFSLLAKTSGKKKGQRLFRIFAIMALIALVGGLGLACLRISNAERLAQPSRSNSISKSDSIMQHSEIGPNVSNVQGNVTINMNVEAGETRNKARMKAASSDYFVRIFNCDDGCQALVNGMLVAKTGFGDDSGPVKISEKLHTGKNTIKIQVINDRGAITYGYEIIKGSEVLYHDACGAVYKLGCENNRDFPVGIAKEFSYKVNKF